MKKIMLLFAAAAASFLLLAYIDEYENLILPLFNISSEGTSGAVPEKTKENIGEAIKEFNDNLSKAYFYSEPSILDATMDARLRASLAEEILYLKSEGKVMDFKVVGSVMNEVAMSSPGLIRVNAVETVRLRYLSLSDQREIVSYPETDYNMVYMLALRNDRWKVISYETHSTK